MNNFVVWCPSLGQTQKDGVKLDGRVYHAISAAESFVERYEWNRVDFSVASGKETLIVKVSKENYEQTFEVSGVNRPVYHAKLLKSIQT